jgi:hypothetical protein
MRSKGLLLLAGVGAPLILSSAASADFVGLKVVNKSIDGFEEWVSNVVNLYAIFSDDTGDGIGDGALIAVSGLPGEEMNISVRDGVFYQNALNTSNAGRTSPPEAFIGTFPSLLVDTFLTIGLKYVPTGHADTTALTPTFPLEGGQTEDGSWSDTRLQIDDGAWFAFNPDSDQARPGNWDNPATQVLIGQFSVAAGAGPNAGVFGTVGLQGEQGDGTVFTDYLSFDSQMGPAPGTLALLGTAGLLGFRRRRR